MLMQPEFLRLLADIIDASLGITHHAEWNREADVLLELCRDLVSCDNLAALTSDAGIISALRRAVERALPTYIIGAERPKQLEIVSAV